MPVGRPSKLTPETVSKLEEIFALDGTVEEACSFADISRDTYYSWIKENPALSDRFESLRQRPFLKARRTIVESLSNPHDAQWYLERKKKKEFSVRVENEVQTEIKLTFDNAFTDATSSSSETNSK